MNRRSFLKLSTLAAAIAAVPGAIAKASQGSWRTTISRCKWIGPSPTYDVNYGLFRRAGNVVFIEGTITCAKPIEITSDSAVSIEGCIWD